MSRLFRMAIPCIFMLYSGVAFSLEKQVGKPVNIESGISMGSIFQVIISLLFILAMIVGMAWVMKRYSGVRRSGDHVISQISSLSLSTRDRIILVQVGNRQLLIGVSPGGINTLHVLEENVSINNKNDGAITQSNIMEMIRKSVFKS